MFQDQLQKVENIDPSFVAFSLVTPLGVAVAHTLDPLLLFFAHNRCLLPAYLAEEIWTLNLTWNLLYTQTKTIGKVVFSWEAKYK